MVDGDKRGGYFILVFEGWDWNNIFFWFRSVMILYVGLENGIFL